MELTPKEYRAKIKYAGSASFIMAEKDELKIQDTGQQGHLLSETVPDGKQWSVTIYVNIVETDA